jgi:hypothetical protein
MQFILRSRRLGAVALGVTGLGAAAVTLAAFPTVAVGAVAAVTSVSCSVTGSNWCISGNNSSSGIGVIGTSKSGTGLRGTSTSQYGLKATSGSGTAILAQTTSGASAITATGSSSGYGVSATANTAIAGNSSATDGAGVFGASSSSGVGVYGYSASGMGGAFYSGNSGYAAYADGEIAYYGLTPSNGIALELFNTSNVHSAVFSVDGEGDVDYKGNLLHESATAGGASVRSFSPNSTQPTVEDTGTAQLVRGAAVVRLDPTFAASIEPAAGYRVFVTPGGETNGLFVVGKSAAGFVVRESHAGRSTVPFDYRIVGTAFGKARQHMAMLSPAEGRTLGSRVRMPVVPLAKISAPAVVPESP